MFHFLLSLSLLLQVPNFNAIDSLEEVVKNQEDTEAKAKAFNELYKEYRNNQPEKALEYAQQALAVARRIDYRRGEASALNNIGVSLRNKGEYEQALDHYYQALKILEEENDEEGLALTLANIGTIYSIKRNFRKARENFEESLLLFEALKDTARLIGIFSNIGNAWLEEGNPQEALQFYIQATELYRLFAQKEKAFDPMTNIGHIYFNRQEYAQALEFYRQSLEIEENNQNHFGQANALMNIGVVYRAMKDLHKALLYVRRAMEIASALEDKPLLSHSYLVASEIYMDMGDPVLAYSFLKEHTKIADELYSEETNRRIAELETAFEFEKKEKEIELLQQENKIQSLKNRNNRIAIGAGIVFTLFLLVAMYLIFRQSQRYKRAKDAMAEQNKHIIMINSELNRQKRIIEHKNRDITDSILYARSIQNAILSRRGMEDGLSDSFILYKPKDIVSGDFYWYTHTEEAELIAAIDCTGHGVAGAFMTVIWLLFAQPNH
ncbi:MAG: tetratricopeptide repeat protein [Cytophagales bacterium]|nr:tetratricopeptide repeat protein [Cytophagales bacterium]